MGLINGLNTALGTPKLPLCTVISAMTSPHSHKIHNLLTDVVSCLTFGAAPFTLCYIHRQWQHLGSVLGSFTGLALPLLTETFCPPRGQGSSESPHLHVCQECFRWHFINAVQPATLNQHKLYWEGEQDERSFILPQAENTFRLFLVVSDGAERKHNDSHCADLLLETWELMVGPIDLMQHAAVTNYVSVALRKNLLESSE